MVTVVIIAAIIALICVIRRSNRAKQIYVTNSRRYSGSSSRSNGSTCSHSKRFHKEPHTGATTGHVGGDPTAFHSNLDNPSPSGWGTFSITADSGIPDLPILEEEQIGPAAKFPHHPTTRSTQEDSEVHAPLQWTLGPAHESRDAPPVIDRFVSVDPSVSVCVGVGVGVLWVGVGVHVCVFGWVCCCGHLAIILPHSFGY